MARDGISIREAVADDAPGVARVVIDTWRTAYADLMPSELLASLDLAEREAALRRALGPSDDGRATFVAERDGPGEPGGRVIGFASVGPCRDEDASEGEGELYALNVLPEHWGTGLGAELLARASRRLEELGCAPVSLWVLSENARARRFYEREGFVLDPARERVAKTARGFELMHARYSRG